MTSYLEILKKLQYSQNAETTVHDNDLVIQTTVQPDLNLQEHQSAQQQYSYSFIEYVPFQRKVIEMEEKVYKQRIPKTKIITYEVQQVFVEKVPKQKIVTDYFAVQHLRYYKKQTIPEKTIEYVPVIRTIKKIEYLPVEKKIVHYPKDIEPEKLKKIDQKFTSIYRSKDKQFENSRVQKTFSPIKEFHPQDSNYEPSKNQSNESSLFESLSKAYTPEPSTQYCSRKSHQKFMDHVSPFQMTRKRRPSTFKQVNYRSTETIDTKYFMNF